MISKMSSQHSNTATSMFLLLLFILSSFRVVAPAGVINKESAKLYIVYLGERKHEDPNLVTASHYDMLSSLLGSKEEARSSIVYSYRYGFSGFAAMLTDSQAEQIAELPEVISIRPNTVCQPHTTRSWDFLGITYDDKHQPDGLLQKANFGDNIIIGVIDSGIWPESRSFDDEGYGPIPSRWKGICQEGQNFTVHDCNRKIIGARWYAGGVDPADLDVDYKSPRDYEGHGTHTASIAAGSLVGDVGFHGLAVGTARGGAPRARLAIYKACWGDQILCQGAGVLKAIDDSIHDGVDILSLSLGVRLYPMFASIHAVAKGITVVYSGGNDGPIPRAVANDLPWVITVAASTIDRSFPTTITLGNNQSVVGQSLNYAYQDAGYRELAFFYNCSAGATNSTDTGGKIVVCADSLSLPGISPGGAVNADIYFFQATKGIPGANGTVVIFGRTPLGLLRDCYGLIGFVCVLVDDEVLLRIATYATTSTSPVAKVGPAVTRVGRRALVVSPRVAAFSSRGPSLRYPDLIKPDITAPGAGILAAVRDSYIFMSGTSMSCPHVSGVAALLKAVHPEWSPAAIKSALVTTAHTTDAYGFPVEADGIPRKVADPFDFGGGHIDPVRAADPGLIYDVDPKDYSKLLQCGGNDESTCDLVGGPLYDLNLPSVSISDLKTSVTVKRTVTNVGDKDSIYRAVVENPPGVMMTVEPSVLEFSALKGFQTFALTFTALEKVQGDFRFGSLTWCDGGSKHAVRIPIAVRVIVEDFFSDTS